MSERDPLAGYLEEVSQLESGRGPVMMAIGPFDVVGYSQSKWGSLRQRSPHWWLTLNMLTKMDGAPETIKRIMDKIIELRADLRIAGYEFRFGAEQVEGKYSTQCTKRIALEALREELRFLMLHLTEESK